MPACAPSYFVYRTPYGPMTIRASAEGVTDVAFGDVALDGQRMPTELASRTATELLEYFAGKRRAFDVPVSPRGTAFQRAVWDELARTPYGETRTSAQLASALGVPGSYRAVGAAVRRNPVAVLVPDHRVVGADGRTPEPARRPSCAGPCSHSNERPILPHERLHLEHPCRHRRLPFHRRTRHGAVPDVPVPQVRVGAVAAHPGGVLVRVLPAVRLLPGAAAPARRPHGLRALCRHAAAGAVQLRARDRGDHGPFGRSGLVAGLRALRPPSTRRSSTCCSPCPSACTCATTSAVRGGRCSCWDSA